MDEFFKIKLRSWITDSIKFVSTEGFTEDLHVDELCDDYKSYDKASVLSLCYDIFCEIAVLIKNQKIDLIDTDLYLSIDLISESNVFLGPPITKTDLINSIDIYSVPEVIVYKPLQAVNVPQIEFYRTPLTAEFEATCDIVAFYKEYRSKEDLLNKGDYIREINLLLNN